MGSKTPGTVLGPYTLRAPLGEGAAATVWLAELDGPGGVRKNVALKLIKGPPDQRVYKTILREARITARLQHPNVVDVLGVEIQGGALFVSMEYVGGGTLRELIRRVKGLGVGFPQSVVVDLLIDILRGLAHAHGTPESKRPPVLHRDLKPENVLLDVTGGAKVGDFGLAKVIGEATMTAPGHIKGTNRYVPPEIWRGGRDFHPRGDLFAVGCMLYELVTLRRLFDGSMEEILRAIMGRTAAQEAESVARVAPGLAPVVERLLLRDPEARYQRAEDVLEELMPLRDGLGAVGDVGVFVGLLRQREGAGAPVSGGLAARLSRSADPRWAVLAPTAGR